MPGRSDAALHLGWGVATDIGRKRAHNEDSYLAQSPMFAVADGMGGHAAGDIASAAVVTRLAELTSAEFVDPAGIEVALREATEDIANAADDDHRGVGTTVTGAAITLEGDEPFWVVFNIGDSRAYRFAHNALEQVSVDHSVVQELIMAGLLDPDDAESHPDSNVITRAVGFNAEPMPDYWMLPVVQGERLLLCSDGLTREVGHERLRLHLAAGLTAAETAQALVDAALAAGGRDNVTAVVIDVLELSGSFDLEHTLPN